MKRALTLVELVAAAALLTLIVVACIPLLRGARADLAGASMIEPGRDVSELEHAVDDLLDRQPGLAERILTLPEGSTERWTVGDREFVALVRGAGLVREDRGSRRSSHAWLVFRVDDAEVVRWVRVRTPAGEEGP